MINNTLGIVGLSWGDEGKGKFVDYIAQRADIVVRFNGGANAGHTICVDNVKYKFKLIPSGAPLEKEVIIANGCVVDPNVLLEEIENLKKLNKKINLKLSSTAHIIFPFHRVLDGLEEESKGKYRAGTTKRGIGPAYSDKVARWGIRVYDLINPDLLRKKLEKLSDLKKRLIKSFDPEWDMDLDSIYDEYKKYGEELKPYVIDTAYYLNKAIDSGKKVVFEGAQGTLLGIDHGMFPYGTSSNSNALGISSGTGVPPKKIGKIREQGHEYGTVTGRPRRVGWLDLFNIKYGIMINGVDDIIITLLDALEGVNPLYVCTEYELDGKILESWPIQSEIIEKCKPIYKEFDGWEPRSREDWSTIARKGYDSLPDTMKIYIEAIEKELNKKCAMISIGPNRNETIVLQDYF